MRKPAKATPGRGSTRERVLDVTLSLLNRHGTDQVTTRSIADAAGINEGNLYYHFRTKEALYLALFDRFEQASLSLLQEIGGDDPGAYAGALPAWFRLSWSYRFLFRDTLAVRSAAPGLRRGLRRLAVRLMAEMARVMAAMQRAGLLRLPDGEHDRLVANIGIVSCYWVSFLTLHRGMRALTEAHMQWGCLQVRSLYAPFLTEAALAAFDRAQDPLMGRLRPTLSRSGPAAAAG